MSTNFLIFPCPLTDIQFSVLREEKQIIQKYFSIKCTQQDKKLRDIQFYIAATCIDIDEILKNHNCHGYRCNAYFLNQISLKLSYIFELTKLYDFEGHVISSHDFSNFHFRISLILETCFRSYRDMLG
jgi:hypothetical protein